MFAVTALGELLIDFTDAGTSAAGQKLFERNPGGAPANVLVALERLGMSCAFIGKVGDDMHGEFLRATLVANDVNCDGLVSDPEHFTTLAFVALSEDGGKTFPLIRWMERGEGFIGDENRTNNRQYEYPYLMQSKDGMLHLAYAARTREGIKYLRFREEDVAGKKRETMGLYNPTAAQSR